MKIRILDRAEEDLLHGYHFYEEQEIGIGSYFLSNLYADIESLLSYAGIHPKTYKGYHRLLSNRFPYAVYYTVEGEEIRIYAVVDCRRDPSWIEGHLE